MRGRVGVVVSMVVVVGWLVAGAVPSAAQSDQPVDPRFDVNFSDPVPLTLVRDSGTGAVYARIMPRQPWVEGPPLDLSLGYFTLQLDADGVMTTLHWEVADGESWVDAASDMGIISWSGYVLSDGSIVVWLPLPAPEPGEFWLDLEMGATDPGSATTYGGRMSTDSAATIDLLFGLNYPIWNLVSNEPMGPPVTESSSNDTQPAADVSDTQPVVTQAPVTTPPASPDPTSARTGSTVAIGPDAPPGGFKPGIVIPVAFTLTGFLAIAYWFVFRRRLERFSQPPPTLPGSWGSPTEGSAEPELGELDPMEGLEGPEPDVQRVDPPVVEGIGMAELSLLSAGPLITDLSTSEEVAEALPDDDEDLDMLEFPEGFEEYGREEEDVVEYPAAVEDGGTGDEELERIRADEAREQASGGAAAADLGAPDPSVGEAVEDGGTGD